jgi:hypothetical protein
VRQGNANARRLHSSTGWPAEPTNIQAHTPELPPWNAEPSLYERHSECCFRKPVEQVSRVWQIILLAILLAMGAYWASEVLYLVKAITEDGRTCNVQSMKGNGKPTR